MSQPSLLDAIPVPRPLARLAAAVRNGLEIARLGGLGSAEASPFEVAVREPVYRLRHYFPDRASGGPPIVLVPPLMLTAEVYDVAPDTSAVALLSSRGVDPWVVDFGAPEREEGGLSRTLADHVVAVSRAVDRVREQTGRKVHLSGYSQGGMFCYQTAAYRRSEGLASLITFGSPVDLHRGLAPVLPDELAIRLVSGLGELLAPLFSRAFVPAWISRTGFRLLDPVKDVQQRIEFLLTLWDREKIVRQEGQRKFLAREGWVAYPGPALRDFLEELLIHNRMLSGGLVIDGRTVTLADITCPVLTVVGETDEIARPPAVRAIRKAAPRAEIFELTMRAGHFGLVVGSKSKQISWPGVASWIAWRENGGERPAGIRTAEEVAADRRAKRAARLEDLGEDAELAVGFGLETVQSLVRAIGDRVGALRRLTGRALPQLPRLVRLSGVRRDTRISMGLVVAEQAAQHPGDTFFLFEGRAYSYADANRRVDAVVRGLLSVGVRQGSHVGVLMRTRPSALAAVTALSRLGAVAVMLRPDGPLVREIALGGVEHLLADPEFGETARKAFGGPVLVLGGGGAPRKLPRGLVDLERIDPDAVTVPAWYEPDPGRAGEVAMIIFSGRGEAVRTSRITNRRWAISAFGTASAAALTAADTVYCCTPVHHATGILVCVGGAVAGGARLAVATRFEPATFWDEVRRYGVNVVFYTGAMLSALVEAPPDAAERGHPVRLFAGSGMPQNVWRRVLDRFAPVGVLEFYASTEGGAVLANLSGEKVGSLGRPLPGSAEVAIAAYDLGHRRLVLGTNGLGRSCDDGETGLLLVRVDPERGAVEGGRLLRGVFDAGDAWQSTGDLFRRDGDGDHWLVDHVADLIDAAGGPLPSIAIEEAVAEIEAVSLAAAYGVRLPGARREIPVVAVTLRAGQSLDPEGLRRAVEKLPPASRPVVVRVLDTMPMTAGYRPIKEPLRAEGIEPSGSAAFVLRPEALAKGPLKSRRA